MQPGDYKRRIQTAQKGALVGAGYQVDPVHIPSNVSNFQVTPAGSVVTLTSINVAPGAGGVNMWFQDANGNKQMIISGAVNARDYKQHFYCPWPVYISLPDGTADVTVYCVPPSKGSTTA